MQINEHNNEKARIKGDIVNLSESNPITLKEKICTFCQKYKHGLLLLYLFLYLPWFSWLEQTVTNHFHVIHMPIDDKIPFNEYFIIPYLLWFAYVAVAVLYFLLKNKDEFYRLCAFLFIGMTIFLIISTVYPNGHHLRPVVFERDNIFTDMVKGLYLADTPTNLFPSIHVYNSIGVNIAVWHCTDFKENKWLRYGSAVFMISIVLSTMFLKQHSVFDVITGIVLSVFMYTVVYTRDTLHAGEGKTALKEQVRQI